MKKKKIIKASHGVISKPEFVKSVKSKFKMGLFYIFTLIFIVFWIIGFVYFQSDKFIQILVVFTAIIFVYAVLAMIMRILNKGVKSHSRH